MAEQFKAKWQEIDPKTLNQAGKDAWFGWQAALDRAKKDKQTLTDVLRAQHASEIPADMELIVSGGKWNNRLSVAVVPKEGASGSRKATSLVAFLAECNANGHAA